MSLCQKVLSKDHPFFYRKYFFRFRFSLTNLTLSERVCIKELIKIKLTPKVSSELVKYENLHQVRAENWQRKGGHFGCTASVVISFASFFFRQFSLCCLTGQSVAMFTRSALRLLSLQTWCQQGAVSEFSIWVMYLFSFDRNVMLRPTD